MAPDRIDPSRNIHDRHDAIDAHTRQRRISQEPGGLSLGSRYFATIWPDTPSATEYQYDDFWKRRYSKMSLDGLRAERDELQDTMERLLSSNRTGNAEYDLLRHRLDLIETALH